MEKKTRFLMLALIALLCTGSLWSQDWGRRDRSPYGPASGDSSLWSQNRGRRDEGRGDPTCMEFHNRAGRNRPARGTCRLKSVLHVAETVTINGNLQLVEGHIAVVADGKTYFVNGLQELTGFIDGLKEDAAVTLEGPATAVPFNSNARFLWVTKLTFNGKTYVLRDDKPRP